MEITCIMSEYQAIDSSHPDYSCLKQLQEILFTSCLANIFSVTNIYYL